MTSPRCAGCGRFVALRSSFLCLYCRDRFCEDCGAVHFGDGSGPTLTLRVAQLDIADDETGLRLDGDLDDVDLEDLRVASGTISAVAIWMVNGEALAVPLVREFKTPGLAEELERELLD